MSDSLLQIIETYGDVVARYVEGRIDAEDQANLEAAAQNDEDLQAFICTQLALAQEPDPVLVGGVPMNAQLSRCRALLEPDSMLAALRSDDFTEDDKRAIVHSVVSMHMMGEEANYIALVGSASDPALGRYAFEARAALVRRVDVARSSATVATLAKPGHSTKHHLRSFLGLIHPLERSTVSLPTFRAEKWALSATADPLRCAKPDVDIARAFKEITFRFTAALGDLMAAQQIQRLCDEGHIAAPVIAADGMEPMDWDLPKREPTIGRGSDPFERHQFVVGLGSNSQFVRLYDEKLRNYISLSLVPGEGDAPDSLWLGLPPGDCPPSLKYYSEFGNIYDEPVADLMTSERTGFILYGRIRHGGKSYFLIGGDSEPRTFLAGVYLRSNWGELWSLVDCDDANDFLIALRVESSPSRSEYEWPEVTPLLVWREQGPYRIATPAENPLRIG